MAKRTEEYLLEDVLSILGKDPEVVHQIPDKSLLRLVNFLESWPMGGPRSRLLFVNHRGEMT